MDQERRLTDTGDAKDVDERLILGIHKAQALPTHDEPS